MNPNSGGESAPRFELPPQHAPETGVEEAREQVHEAETSGEGAAGKQQPKLTPPPQTTTTAPPPTLPVPDPLPPQAAVPTQQMTAQDVDLIEKQWVHETKKAIDKNKDDPFKQKDELARIKADYVKKRFNKVIPTDGDGDKKPLPPPTPGPQATNNAVTA